MARFSDFFVEVSTRRKKKENHWVLQLIWSLIYSDPNHLPQCSLKTLNLENQGRVGGNGTYRALAVRCTRFAGHHRHFTDKNREDPRPNVRPRH